MRLGICDDENIIRNELIGLCNRYQEINLIKFDVVDFSSGEELLNYTKPIDILFLDVQMKGINGLETAMKIRENDDSMTIIFLTGYRSFMQEGYHVKAFRYLLKPLTEVNFIKTLNEAFHDITKNNKVILGKDGNTFFVRFKDILYIEYGFRCSLVRTKKCYYESTHTMNEWQSILNSGDFFRVHKAYIVNMEYVEEIDKNIILENGEKVEVAFRQKAKFIKACKEYRRRNAR